MDKAPPGWRRWPSGYNRPSGAAGRRGVASWAVSSGKTRALPPPGPVSGNGRKSGRRSGSFSCKPTAWAVPCPPSAPTSHRPWPHPRIWPSGWACPVRSWTGLRTAGGVNGVAPADRSHTPNHHKGTARTEDSQSRRNQKGSRSDGFPLCPLCLYRDARGRSRRRTRRRMRVRTRSVHEFDSGERPPE